MSDYTPRRCLIKARLARLDGNMDEAIYYLLLAVVCQGASVNVLQEVDEALS